MLRALILCAALWPAAARGDAGFMLEPTFALPAPLYLRGGRDVNDEAPRSVPYTLDANIAPHLPLGTNLSELDTRDGLAHAVIFTPRVDLRHGSGTSYPIRTPSFYPRVRIQLVHQRTLPRLRRRFVVEGVIAHLSNGQDGCLYLDQRRDGARCVDGAPGLGRRALNHRDGSFSTNETGLRLGLEVRRDGAGRRDQLSALVGVISFRPHSLGLDPELAAVYGKARLEGELDVRRTFRADGPRACDVALHAFGTARVGGPHVRSPFALTLDLRTRFARAYGWGPMLRLHVGSDPYNVRFDVPIVMLALGAGFGG
jgi:hypothetical protein